MLPGVGISRGEKRQKRRVGAETPAIANVWVDERKEDVRGLHSSAQRSKQVTTGVQKTRTGDLTDSQRSDGRNTAGGRGKKGLS